MPHGCLRRSASEPGLLSEKVQRAAQLSSKIIKNATLKVYPGAPHGLMETHREQFHKDLLAFAQS